MIICPKCGSNEAHYNQETELYECISCGYIFDYDGVETYDRA